MNWKSNKTIGGLIILIGLFFLIENLFGNFEFWKFIWKLWPLALIFLGILVLKHRKNAIGDAESHESSSESVLFGDLDIIISESESREHNYSILFGDTKIDASRFELKPGENKIIVSSLIGDILIKIPEEVPVRLSTKFLIGDVRFEDLRREGFFQRLDHSDDTFESSEKKLVIDVRGLIGDLRINRIKINDVH